MADYEDDFDDFEDNSPIKTDIKRELGGFLRSFEGFGGDFRGREVDVGVYFRCKGLFGFSSILIIELFLGLEVIYQILVMSFY